MKHFVVFFALILLSACNAKAQDRFLDIQQVTSPGGIEGWLVQDDTLPIIALQYVFLDSGTTLDPEAKQGLVRMLSNTMDEGAGELDSTAFQKALADHSITLRFSASRDGFGGRLKTLTRHKDKAFDLLKIALTAPRFDTEPVDRMRNANMTRIRSSLADPDWIAARILNDRMYSGHPYAMNSGGTLTTLPAITPDDLRDFYTQYLTQDRLVVVAAGDISAGEFQMLLDTLFGHLPAQGPEDIVPGADVSNPGTIALYQKDIPQTVIQIALPAFGRDHPDYYALQVLNYIFGGAGFGSRLMETAREKEGLTYGIFSSISDNRKIDLMRIGTSTKNESVMRMLEIIRAEMQKLQTEPVPEDELNNAKSYLTGSLSLSLTSTDKIASVLMGLRTQDLPADYLDHYADKINAVSAADIQRVARDILIPEKMTVTLVGTPQLPEGLDNLVTITDIPNAE